MAGLVDELQRLASDPGVAVTDLLRKVKLVAAKLHQTDTAAWVDAELSGNFKAADIPAYRKLPVRLTQRNEYYGYLPLGFEDPRLNAIVNEARPVTRPISEIEQIVEADAQTFYMTLPSGAAQQLVKWGAPTTELYHSIPRMAFSGIIDGVKTRVLDWAIMLEQRGVLGEGMSFSAEEKKRAEGATVHINGDIGNFAGVIGQSIGTGASGTHQEFSYDSAARNIAAKLREAATTLDPVDSNLLVTAAESIDEAVVKSDQPALRKALGWAKAALPKVAGWATKTAAEHEIDQLLDVLPI